MPQPELKIVVRATGEIFLDGQEVTLGELAGALDAAKLEGSTVRYTRENPAAEAPPEVEDVMKMITSRRLRIALSGPPEPEETKPSKVIEFPGPELLFAKVRKQAAANRVVSLLRPNQVLYGLAAPAPGTINPQLEAGVRAMVSDEQQRNIAALAAPGALSAGDLGKAPVVAEIARQVPFFGLLVGLAYIGHAVWLFEASADMVPVGCEEADVALIDSNAVPNMPQGWAADIGAIMRNPNILVFDRSRNKMGVLRTAGEVPGRLEFPA